MPNKKLAQVMLLVNDVARHFELPAFIQAAMLHKLKSMNDEQLDEILTKTEQFGDFILQRVRAIRAQEDFPADNVIDA